MDPLLNQRGLEEELRAPSWMRLFILSSNSSIDHDRDDGRVTQARDVPDPDGFQQGPGCWGPPARHLVKRSKPFGLQECVVRRRMIRLATSALDLADGNAGDDRCGIAPDCSRCGSSQTHGMMSRPMQMGVMRKAPSKTIAPARGHTGRVTR